MITIIASLMASAVINQCLDCCCHTAPDKYKPSPGVVVNLPELPERTSFRTFHFVQQTTASYPVHPCLQTISTSTVVRDQPRGKQKSQSKPGLPFCLSDSAAECKTPTADRQFTHSSLTLFNKTDIAILPPDSSSEYGDTMGAELHSRGGQDPDHMAATKRCDVVYPFVQFSIFHDIQQQTLRLHIVRACNLRREKGKKQCNPFLSCFLDPNREEVFETQVAQLATPSSDDSTSNCHEFGEFGETFLFKRITLSEIPRQTLILKVYHRDLLSRSEQIGFIALPLGRIELYGEEMLMRLDDHSQQPKVRRLP